MTYIEWNLQVPHVRTTFRFFLYISTLFVIDGFKGMVWKKIFYVLKILPGGLVLRKDTTLEFTRKGRVTLDWVSVQVFDLYFYYSDKKHRL